MKGHSVGSGTGYSVVPDLKKVPGTTEVKLYDGNDPCVRDLSAKRLDFAVLDAPIIAYIIQQNPDLKLKQIPLAPDPDFPILTRKFSSIWGMNPNNPDLFDGVNRGIRWLWSTGQIAGILKTYGIDSPDYLEPPTMEPIVTPPFIAIPLNRSILGTKGGPRTKCKRPGVAAGRQRHCWTLLRRNCHGEPNRHAVASERP